MAEQANFKRINFFEGFFTTDEDWNASEAYHLEKRRLHNRVLHTPGVVPVSGGGLRVQARGRGDLSFEVAPGYGIDGRGNELVLRDPAVARLARAAAEVLLDAAERRREKRHP